MTQDRTNQNGRIALRVLLAIFVVVALATLVVPNTLGGNWANAQSSPSPSPTGPQIEFLNPSGATVNAAGSGPGREISARQDVDTAYHLVAWVASMPSNPTVEFKYQRGDEPEVTIATGTLRGTDTFDAFWSGSAMPADGAYTLKAILYSDGLEVDRDEEPVVINNQDASKNQAGLPTSENQGQTVEITYPRNAGNFGLYRKPGTTNPYHGVIDVVASEGTTEVRGYYTTSRPGTEPQWFRCSSPEAGETFENARDGVRCTLGTGVNPGSVTAVAAASGDANQTATSPDPTCAPGANCGEGEDSGDAHRALPYIQVPSNVTIAPATQRKEDTDAEAAGSQFPCSDVITATVLDQVARKVAGANVDVHASGPTDNLFFDGTDASGDQTSPHQPPDRGGHTTESTVDCESDTTNPRPFTSGDAQAQGEHEVAGEGDIKHIETQPQGTDDAGAFRFALHNRSTTITGVTQFTAYQDRDDDDQMCSQEARGHGSIGWGADPGTPTGVPDETATCPEPTASPTGSPSPSPTPTPRPTGTASPSPTGTASPSPTGTASPSPTGTASPSDRPECSDERDNDGDGDVDYPADADCASRTDDSESTEGTPQQEYGGDRGEPVASGPCAGYNSGSVQQNPDGPGLVIVGTNGPDTLQGSDDPDVICGLGGPDTIDGAGGGDRLYGNAGKDEIGGGDGDDRIFGNLGKDVIVAAAGNDYIEGGNQNDNISGRDGEDTLFGQAGWDTLKGNAGNDIIQGGGGNDIIQGGGGRDVARGNAGDDVLKGFSGDDRLVGGKHNDILRGSAGDDFLKGGPGDDILNGGADNDTCRGGGGNNITRRCE